MILNSCSRLTDRGLSLIGRRCPELRHLEIKGCVNVTNIGIFELVTQCVNLDHLDVTGKLGGRSGVVLVMRPRGA